MKFTHTELLTPSGVPLHLDVCDICRTTDTVRCAVKKDSGDDPDATKGILIYAEVSKTNSGITIDGGVGIGTVTKAACRFSRNKFRAAENDNRGCIGDFS